MTLFKYFIFILSILTSNFLVAQDLCRKSKEHQTILKKSQIHKNQYLSMISFPNQAQQFYVKENNKKTNLNYKICDLKIEGDYLVIEGFIKPSKNTFINNYFFLVGNKMDTTYYYKWRSSYTNFKTITSGPFDAIYLRNAEYKNTETIDLLEIPEKLYFYYKLNIYDKSLFIISTDHHYTEIFNLIKIKEILHGLNQ